MGNYRKLIIATLATLLVLINFSLLPYLHRKKAVTISIAGIMALAVLFCMGNASHVIDALAPMVLGINMLVGGLAVVIVFQYFCKDIRSEAVWSIAPVRICLRYVAPALLSVILIGNLLQEFESFDAIKGVRWSWFAFALFTAWTLSQWNPAEKDVPVELACKEA